MLAGETHACGIALIERAERRDRGIRDELHVSSRRNFLEPSDGSFLRKPALKLAADRRIIGTLTVARNYARQDYTPLVGGLGLEAQILEWNFNQRDVTAA